MSSPNEINRANAQHSTGPKTEAGKQKSSLNALRHGLTGQVVLLPTDDPQVYEAHLKSLVDLYQPSDPNEAILVQFMADTAWRLNRITALESKLLMSDASIEVQYKALASLSMHSQRLSRQYERTDLRLRQIQDTRRAQEKDQLDKFLNITELYKSKGKTYDGPADGFVFSESQITAAIRARSRQKLSAIALAHHYGDIC